MFSMKKWSHRKWDNRWSFVVGHTGIAGHLYQMSSNLVPKMTGINYHFQFVCSKFLLESAAKVGIEGAEEFLKDPNNGLKEVNYFYKQTPLFGF